MGIDFFILQHNPGRQWMSTLYSRGESLEKGKNFNAINYILVFFIIFKYYKVIFYLIFFGAQTP